MSNLDGYIAQCLVSLEELRLCQQQLKNTQKHIPNFFFPVHFDWITPFCSKYFARDCLIKQIFGPNLVQSPLNSNFLTFIITPKHFYELQQKYKPSRVKIPNLMVLCKYYFAYLIQVKNLTLKSFQLCFDRSVLIEATFLSQMSSFSRNLNHHRKRKESKENLQAILVILF